MYDRILFPTDGSDAARAAKEHAFDHARQYDAELHVLYVADTTKYSTVTFEEGVADVLEEEGWEVVDAVADEADRSGLDVVDVVVQGRPHQQIVEYADEQDVDLVTMGTHGHSGLKRTILGSTTERVLRESNVPVLAVPAGETDGE
ncbi:universal stress protein [Halospeciosus flavus]|uniref:Universal stress protein n=1 Tax=Halospeciosus flavus TaxID=3032283 RepID=A0ABD5Z9B3_9EURY|nr:universal stress protein [Halospeciosus flavus]